MFTAWPSEEHFSIFLLQFTEGLAPTFLPSSVFTAPLMLSTAMEVLTIRTVVPV